MSAPVFTAHAIAKRFGATVALARLDLAIGAGEVVALMGANGAGKSTLVKIVSGVQAADEGAMTLDGQSYAPASPLAAKRQGVATVHQSVADVVVSALSIADNLLLDELCGGIAAIWTPRARRLARSRELAARVGLHDVDLDVPLGTLSLAAQQRVVLARALATRPRLLILDEPTASLSAAEAERLYTLIDGLRAEGVGVLLVSHRLADLRRLASRVAVVRDGRIVAAQDAPIDFDAALETMIGRRLPVGTAKDEPNEHAKPALELRGVQLGPHSDPFDLDVRDGEIVAVVGPVGAGKTRLAQTIFGATRASAGTMRLYGEPWRPRTPRDAIRAGVFLAGEDRWRSSLFPDAVPFASVAGTIGFPFLPRWSRAGVVLRTKEREIAHGAIDTFGIRCAGPDDRVARLSGGNQQKVLLARWHAEPARLLLLDEPFQGVDAGARADIAAMLRRRAAGRATLVFVSDLEEAHEVADRIVQFDRGTVEVARDIANALIPT